MTSSYLTYKIILCDTHKKRYFFYAICLYANVTDIQYVKITGKVMQQRPEKSIGVLDFGNEGEIFFINFYQSLQRLNLTKTNRQTK